MENEEKKTVIEEARKEAEKEVSGFLSPDQVGYEFQVREMMKKLLKEKEIDWNPDEETIIVD